MDDYDSAWGRPVTSLSPPTDDRVREWRTGAIGVQGSITASTLAQGYAVQIEALCDALLRERAAHSATKAALDTLVEAAGFLVDTLGANPPRSTHEHCHAGRKLAAALACLSEPSPTKDTNQ